MSTNHQRHHSTNDTSSPAPGGKFRPSRSSSSGSLPANAAASGGRFNHIGTASENSWIRKAVSGGNSDGGGGGGGSGGGSGGWGPSNRGKQAATGRGSDAWGNNDARSSGGGSSSGVGGGDWKTRGDARGSNRAEEGWGVRGGSGGRGGGGGWGGGGGRASRWGEATSYSGRSDNGGGRGANAAGYSNPTPAGKLAPGHSLRLANTFADLVCMVTDDIASDVTAALGEVWDHVVVVPRLEARQGVRQRRQGKGSDEEGRQQLLADDDVRRAVEGLFHTMRGCTLLLAPSRRLFDDLQWCSRHHPIGHWDAMAGPDEYFNSSPHLPPCTIFSSPPSLPGCTLLLAPSRRLFDDLQWCARHHPIGHWDAMAGPDEYFISKFFLDRGVPWTHVHMREGLFTCAAMVGPDEYFISKFFLDRGVPWSLMHMRFGAISWVVDEALKGQVPPVFGAISWVVDEALQGQAPPVFIHYVSEKPWVAPAGPSTAPAGPTSTVKTSTPAVTSTVTNWSDFLVWDSIAEQVVGLLHAAGEEEAGAASRLFAGWDARRKLPVVFPEKQG
ncbi:unnamed protein product [Closterium sp. NIES-65]|nr:unnamed protein product [Closterium sp. NIES-65]